MGALLHMGRRIKTIPPPPDSASCVTKLSWWRKKNSNAVIQVPLFWGTCWEERGLTRNIRVGGVWVGNGACVTIYSI